MNFEEAEKMFQVTCKRSPRTCRNVADSVEFVATYPVDGCRFWMMLVHTEKNVRQSGKIDNREAVTELFTITAGIF